MWKGLYATGSDFSSVVDEIKATVPLDRGANIIARVVDDLRAAVTPRKLSWRAAGGIEDVPHELGQRPAYVCLESLSNPNEIWPSVAVISWTDTHIKVAAIEDTDFVLYLFRGTKFQ